MIRACPFPTLAIVPTYLRAQQELDVLLACLVSLQASAPGTQVLVVDDHSPDPALAEMAGVAAEQLGMAFVRKDENSGFAATVNVGLEVARASGADAVLVNADIEFTHAGWLDVMQRPHGPARPPGRRRRRPAAVPERPAPARRRLRLAPRPRVPASLPARPGRPARGARAVRLPGDGRAPAHPPRDARAGRALRRVVRARLRGRRLLPARVRRRRGVHLRAGRGRRSITRACSAATPTRASTRCSAARASG